MNTNTIPGASARPVRPAQLTVRMSKAEGFEVFVLVLILLAVGLAAGAGSFTHVHDWTMHNSPANTGDWFGWANAVISELVPVASLLVMRRRKRAGQPVGYPMFLLVTALGLSITAQLAVAKHGLTGSVVSVIPALAFAALAKLILGKAPTPQVETHQPFQTPTPPVPRPQTVTPAPVVHAAQPVQDRPAVRVPTQDDQPRVAAPSPTPNIAAQEVPAPVRRTVAAPLPADLLARAREAADKHLQETGRVISRDELRQALRVSNGTTGDVMRALNLHETPKSLPGSAMSPLTGNPLLPTS